MSAQKLAFILFGVWALVYTGSFVSFIMAEPTGDGFTRGLNRITNFLGWQFGAGILALIIWSMGKHFEAGSKGRWLCRLPVLLAFGLVLFVIGIIVFANITHPPPQKGTSNVEQETTVPIPDNN
ncbi:MAG: hypothetical protein KUG70_07190 [Rhodobacteraceae bacterium]|nr:hypothetical protein [Paracoccaceae bacterium]